MDPFGQHGLVSMTSGQNFYLPCQRTKPQLLSKVKGLTVESVAWNPLASTSTSTRNFLLGTTKGVILEASIEGEKEKVFRKLFELTESDKDRVPCCGLHLELAAGDDSKAFVLAATPRRLYQFSGPANLEVMFAKVATNPQFRELPGSLAYSVLQVFSKPGVGGADGASDVPNAEACAWMTGAGIYHGSTALGEEEVLASGRLLAYPEFEGPSTPSSEAPLSLALTEFHFLLLHRARLSAVNTLSGEIVYEESFQPGQAAGSMRGLCADMRKGTAWLYADRAVFEVEIEREDRHIWKLYLGKGQFTDALDYCDTEAQKEQVYNAQADHHFLNKQYDRAARAYARTRRSFEEIALRFLQLEATGPGQHALKTYLMSKLETLKPADLTQHAMICTWLTEIFLDTLHALQPRMAPGRLYGEQHEEKEEEYQQSLQEFRDFLDNYSDCLNRDTTFQLISSHGRITELLYYAQISGELEWLLSHHIQHQNFHEALAVLAGHDKPNKIIGLFYKFCPSLISYIPEETVELLCALDCLDPAKLIPALMRYEPRPDQPNLAIRYLEHEVQQRGNRDPAIHNYLVSLYAHEEDEGPLLDFIDAHLEAPVFDYKYALRLCHDQRKTRACVKIYAAMGQMQEAVVLALAIDADFAHSIVRDSETSLTPAVRHVDDEERKRLWLIIARHLIVNNRDVSRAMTMLKPCDLRLEDILPYFPDFVRIGDFKDEICDSLEGYNTTIEDLKSEMDMYTGSAERIRDDISDLRNRSGFVTASQKCDMCARPVLVRQFCLFPCTHVFHTSCLQAHVREFLDRNPRMKRDVLAEVESEASEELAGVTDAKQREDVLLRTYASSQCVFCGDIMIESVQEPFVLMPGEDPDLLSSWAI